jgi:hypothetical protein
MWLRMEIFCSSSSMSRGGEPPTGIDGLCVGVAEGLWFIRG